MIKYISQDELYHHGIKGMKWGVRRFQNRDGTYTSAGKRRRNSENDSISNSTASRSKSGVGKKIAKGLVIGAAIGASAYALSKLNEDHILAAKDYIANHAPEFKKKAVSNLKSAGKDAGKAMQQAAMATIGTIVVSKIANATSRIDTGNSDTNQILRESINAGARTFVGNTTSSSGSGSKYKSGPIDRKKGEEISRIVGPPKQKDIDRSGPEYQALFKNRNGEQRDPDTRGIIKSMASAGYGVDQISTYLNKLDKGEIRHSMIYYYNPYELYHHGIKGKKWGVRRFQNSDGTLTRAGQLRYETKNSRREYLDSSNKSLGLVYLTATPAGFSKEVRGKLLDSANKTNTAYANYMDKRGQYKIEKKRESGASAEKIAKMEYKEGLKSAKRKADTELVNKANDVARNVSTGKTVATFLLGRGLPSSIYALQESGMSRGKAVVTNLLLGNVGAKTIAEYRVMSSAKKEYEETHKKP